MDHGTRDESSSENSRDEVVSDTVIVIRSAETACVVGGGGGEDRDSKGEGNVLGTSKVSMVEEQRKINVCENEKHLSCVIDVKCSGGGCRGGFGDNWDGEKVCRICHLSSDQPSETTNTITTTTTTATTTTDLIQLGCGCKDELGIAHTQCAEAWFKLRGNRLCEICGETAKNITGVGDYRFMDEWNETRFTGSSTSSSDRGGGCWRGQPFCNFLMACLVIAFVLPWFFRVNMF